MKKRILALLFTLLLFGPALTALADDEVPSARSQAVGGDVFLGGKYLEIGISQNGSFGTASNAPAGFHSLHGGVGLSVDADGFDYGKEPVTGDFLLPGTPEEYFILAYMIDGTKYNHISAERMGNVWADPIEQLHTVDQSEPLKGLLKAVTTGVTKENIRYTQVVSFYEDDKNFRTDVTIENLSDITFNDVRYLRSLDPDQDADLNGIYDTYNKVVSNPRPPYAGEQTALVVARGGGTLNPFFYYSSDPRARASTIGESGIQDAYLDGLWVEDDPVKPTKPLAADYALDAAMLGAGNLNGFILEDEAVSIAFNLGDLAAGQSVNFSYYSGLDPDLQGAMESIVRNGFVPVSNITELPATATARIDLPLSGIVHPSNATHQAIVWSVKDAGDTGAIIDGNLLKTTQPGTAIVTASIPDGTAIGTPYTQDFTIIVMAGNPRTGAESLPVVWLIALAVMGGSIGAALARKIRRMSRVTI